MGFKHRILFLLRLCLFHGVRCSYAGIANKQETSSFLFLWLLHVSLYIHLASAILIGHLGSAHSFFFASAIRKAVYFGVHGCIYPQGVGFFTGHCSVKVPPGFMSC